MQRIKHQLLPALPDTSLAQRLCEDTGRRGPLETQSPACARSSARGAGRGQGTERPRGTGPCSPATALRTPGHERCSFPNLFNESIPILNLSVSKVGLMCGNVQS